MSDSGLYLRRDRPPPAMVRLSPERLPADLDETYRAMAQMTAEEPARWGAWKLGGTNAGSRAAFKVDRLYYGAIAADEILDQPVAAPGVGLAELKGEAEIALRIAADGQGWDAWAVALEMPASPIEDLVRLGVRALVADRCAAGALILGPVQQGPLPDSRSYLTQTVGGHEQARGRINDLTAPPAELFDEFLALARGHGAPLAPGQWVATGGVTPCICYAEGDRVVVSLDDRPHVSITIATSD